MLAVGGREREREEMTTREPDGLHSGRVMDGAFGGELSHVKVGDVETARLGTIRRMRGEGPSRRESPV